MTRRARRLLTGSTALVALVATTRSAGAQCADSAYARVAADSARAPAASAPSAVSPDKVFDRVITLAIDDRTWQRDTVQAGVALGASGVAGTRRAPWHACVGASVSLGRVTATLHNVHGLIRIHADLRALEAIGNARGRIP
jgi:hypothetical protein